MSCLESLNDDKTVLFCHEDMFLYDQPDFTLLKEFTDLVSNEKCHLIKLTRAFENLKKSKIHEKLFFNPGFSTSI